MTPTSGSAICARRQISPGPFMPSSRIAASSVPARRSSVSGRPTRLFCVPVVRSTRPGPRARARIAASISLVVVLPLLPVTATMRGPQLLAVVEMALHGADDLVVLVPLAGNQDEVARAREADGERDRRAPVRLDDVAGHPRGTHALLDVREDAQRILGARVVGGEDH